MVKLLLDMKERLDTVLIDAFGRAEAFGHALKDAFEHFINQRANRCAQLSAATIMLLRCCHHLDQSCATHVLSSSCDP